MRSHFAQKESRGNPTLEIFRRANGPALIIPDAFGGMGVRPVDAIRYQRAVAAAAPSMALASNMHHFTVALLAEFAVNSPQIRYLLRNTADSNLYLASGFAEGSTSQSTLTPKMTAEQSEKGYVLNGSKKPCSLSHSMDILTASVGIQCANCGPRFGVAIIPANTAGLTVHDFWTSPILAGTESDEVILHDVCVERQNMVVPGDETDYAAMQAGSFIWFQLLTTSCYIGVGRQLLKQLIENEKGSSEGRVDVACDLEGAMSMLEGVAYSFQLGERSEALVTRLIRALCRSESSNENGGPGYRNARRDCLHALGKSCLPRRRRPLPRFSPAFEVRRLCQPGQLSLRRIVPIRVSAAQPTHRRPLSESALFLLVALS